MEDRRRAPPRAVSSRGTRRGNPPGSWRNARL